jgi:phage protein D
MSTITFDTLKFVERLEKAGMPREQASALAEAQKEAFAEALDSTLASKADVLSLKVDVALLDAKMDKLSWMMGILIALAAANFGKQFF